MEFIRIENDGRVRIVRLERGKANALNAAMVEDLLGDGAWQQPTLGHERGVSGLQAWLLGHRLDERGPERVHVGGVDREAGGAAMATEADQVVATGGDRRDGREPATGIAGSMTWDVGAAVAVRTLGNRKGIVIAAEGNGRYRVRVRVWDVAGNVAEANVVATIDNGV